jgi:two-component system OmpR family response regulator
MRVLVVEDEVKMAALVRRGLIEEGHAADVASTGEDAIWMAQAHPYDAIVLDVMLPRLSGSTSGSPCRVPETRSPGSGRP